MENVNIFYFCHSHNRPNGGQRDTYRQVDILNDAGISAWAWHRTPGFRLDWFENQTRVIDDSGLARILDLERDYLVLPEDLGPALSRYPGRKVIYNKSLFHGFRVFGTKAPEQYPYSDPNVAGVFSVSDHNLEHLRFAFPHTRFYRVFSEIDANTFRFRPLSQKKLAIATVAKAQTEIAVLYHMLHARAQAGLNRMQECEWTVLRGRPESEVAQILGDSLLLVFFSFEEGLPRTILEAMSCGCLIAACGCGPLNECLPAGYQFPHGKYIDLIGHIENLMAEYPHGAGRWQQAANEAGERARMFSIERHRRSVLDAWDDILTRTWRAGASQNVILTAS